MSAVNEINLYRFILRKLTTLSEHCVFVSFVYMFGPLTIFREKLQVHVRKIYCG